MGSLRVGDELASIDGGESRVVGVFPQGEREVYRVEFSDGRSAECCLEHLWRVHYRAWSEPRVLSTERLIEMLQRKRYRAPRSTRRASRAKSSTSPRSRSTRSPRARPTKASSASAHHAHEHGRDRADPPNAGNLVTGIPTGYDRFNELTSGFQPQDLIILAARPSMGKTSFMMNIAESIAIPGKDGQPRNGGERLYGVGVFSLEMSKEQIGLRILSSESGVSNHLIRSGMLSERNWRDLAEAAARLAKGKIYIDDTPGMDPLEMRAKARRLKMEVGLDMIMVDYLQLMAVKGKIESRQQEISQISRGLKAIAKELNVPLLSLSQLSRRPEQRTGDHRPQLSDLRESGSIEQDADVVCFIYRDEVYNKETEEKGIAEIIIAKQRNGPIGDFKLVFRNDITKFFNYEPQPEYLPPWGTVGYGNA